MSALLQRPAAVVRRHPIAVLALGAVLALAGFGAYRAGCYFYAEHHLRAALEAEAGYDFDEARDHLAACLRVRPQSAALHLQMARVERRAGRYEEAEEHLKACRTLEGKTPENALEGVLLQAQWGAIADVESTLQHEVDRGSPEAAQILEALAQGYITTYRLDAALYCLNRLLDREPDNVQALLWRASLWQTAGGGPKEEADLRRAVEAQPDHVGARCRLGQLLLRKQRGEEALAQFEHAHQRRPEDPAVLLGLARSHRQLGHTSTARQLLERLLAAHPHEGQALVERGKIALESESPAAADSWLRRAVADYPFDPQSNYLLARSLRGQGKEEEAQTFDAAAKRIEDDAKRLEAAFARVSRSPRDPEARLEAGRICLRNGQPREGERWLLSAVELNPDYGPARAALADHYERTGRPDLAEPYRRPRTGH